MTGNNDWKQRLEASIGGTEEIVVGTFDFLMPIAGGLLIGLAAAGLMLLSGKIAGVSGIFQGLLSPRAGDIGWRMWFVGGLMVGGTLLLFLQPQMFATGLERSLPVVALGGLLVGFGARLGSGCTSGHGICGMARLGPRSIVATLTFVGSGALATFLINRFAGGAL
jgi:uncharacterized membrane protein YedE/YeeE